MNTAHIEALIGTLVVLGLLALLVLPSVFGIVHDRRADRQLRQAETAQETGTARGTGTAWKTARARSGRPAPRGATTHRTARAA